TWHHRWPSQLATPPPRRAGGSGRPSALPRGGRRGCCRKAACGMNDLRATYRLQFRNGMTFERAAELVPYLTDLSISHLYASPIFRAAPGSTHGYDVADHQELEPELGGSAGFSRLAEALQQHGLGLMLDIVPNHMAVSTANPWWRD